MNVADYARVPLLNPDQKVKDWREKLPALENEYDSRMIPIGKMDPGVYLIEAVNDDMRAYSIAIVTNLTMVRKRRTVTVRSWSTSSIARRARRTKALNVEVTNAKKTLATGTTDKTGVFKTEVKPPETTEETPAEDVDPEESQSKRVSDHGARTRQLCHLGRRLVLLRRRRRRQTTCSRAKT